MARSFVFTVVLLMVGLWGPGIHHLSAETGAPRLTQAEHLVDFDCTQRTEGTQCVLVGDGEISDYEVFTLGNPLRIVLDLRHVAYSGQGRELPVNSPELTRIRIGTYTDKVRVVFDIPEEHRSMPPYRVDRERERLLLLLGAMATGERVIPQEQAALPVDKPTEALQVEEPGPTMTDAAEKTSPEGVNTPSREGGSDRRPGEETIVQASAKETTGKGGLALEEAIQIALENNFSILSAREAIEGSEHRRKSALADFFPKLSVGGTYSWLSETPTVAQEATPDTPVFNVADPDLPEGAQIGVIPGTPALSTPVGKQQPWSVQGSVTQPLFTGGALVNQYSLARIGVESAKTALERAKQNLSLQVVRDFFNVLNAIAQKSVADKAVELLESQRKVSQEFYNVGMIPKNDLLQTEVQLAERIREQTQAANAVELAKAQLNVTLQRPVQTPVQLKVPAKVYAPFPVELENAIRTSQEQRIEVREQTLKVEASERQVRIEQSKYFPQIQLTYNLFKTEGRSFSALPEGWTLEADATWNFWEWGKKYHDVSAARSQLLRDRFDLMQLKDQISLEVKEAYLALTVADRNIFVAEKAVEQGEENFRMNQERYKEQVGTITEVLDAETLLRKAETDYFNALRNHNVAKAALRRAMGLKVYELAEESSTEILPTQP